MLLVLQTCLCTHLLHKLKNERHVALDRKNVRSVIAFRTKKKKGVKREFWLIYETRRGIQSTGLQFFDVL